MLVLRWNTCYVFRNFFGLLLLMLEELKTLIVLLESKDLTSMGDDDGVVVTKQASRNARHFLDSIVDKYELPKVAADGEGGLVFAWEEDNRTNVVVGFAEKVIYAVEAPGTNESKHFEEETYYDEVPLKILQMLPMKKEVSRLWNL